MKILVELKDNEWTDSLLDFLEELVKDYRVVSWKEVIEDEN